MEERKFSIPIYLNQRTVFDLLAVVEEGFSQLQSVKTSKKDEKETNSGLSADVGTKNVFAFLNLGLKAGLNHKGAKTAEKEIQEERVFTPASLFSKLRDKLLERKLINSLDEEFDESIITPGSFVEFSGILRKNPMVAYMEGFIQMFEVALLFTESQGKQKPKAEQEFLTQMRKFSNILKQTGSLDLISESVSASNMKAIVPVQLDYFSNESPADIIDGQFVVLGKVVRYIPEESQESINLLRGTPLAYLPDENLKQFTTAFHQMSSQMSMPVEFTTQINGPALLVIPIAIYA